MVQPENIYSRILKVTGQVWESQKKISINSNHSYHQHSSPEASFNWSNNKARFSFNQPNRNMGCQAGQCKTPTSLDILVTSSLEGWPTKAKETLSPHEVRLTLLDTNTVFQCLRVKSPQIILQIAEVNPFQTNVPFQYFLKPPVNWYFRE